MATAGAGMVAPVSVKTSMSYDDSKVDDFERKSMGSDEGSDDYKVRSCGSGAVAFLVRFTTCAGGTLAGCPVCAKCVVASRQDAELPMRLTEDEIVASLPPWHTQVRCLTC